MLIGFCLGTFGLAIYTTYINYSCQLDNKLFQDVEHYIWILNYYLKLDIFGQYRIMNIGTAIYIYGAICYAIMLSGTFAKKKYYIYLAILPILIIVIYDPYILSKIYQINHQIPTNQHYNQYMYRVDSIMRYFNMLFNILIKIYLFGAVYIMIYHLIKTPRVLVKKYQYILFGVIPINVLFFVLFFGFPNHRIVFRRYEQLYTYSYTYSNMLYTTISVISFVSMCTLIYALFRYNIFEVNNRKTQIHFENQVKTAHFGIRIFSHSIKNQFVAIKLLSEQLAKEVKTERREDLLTQISLVCDESVNRLGTLSRDIGQIKLSYERIHIQDHIENIMRVYMERHESIDFHIESCSSVTLYVDQKHLKKVMENHINNAIEAKSKHIRIHITEKHNYGIITIRDDGEGIPKKDLKKIFRPFYSTKPTVTNWGVGLSFCQKVINAFGGVIHVDSIEGEGTQVAIYIPNIRRI